MNELEAYEEAIKIIKRKEKLFIPNEPTDRLFITQDELLAIKQALTPPTEEEVCKALSEEYNVKFTFDGKWFWLCHPEHGNEILKITALVNRASHLITLIGRFYENMKASDV